MINHNSFHNIYSLAYKYVIASTTQPQNISIYYQEVEECAANMKKDK